MTTYRPGRTKLLVSVRSAAEAEAACLAGADLIDVKEPLRGSLGRADRAVILDVIRQVAGRVPVSAAGGELAEATGEEAFPPGLAFVKWGLSDCRGSDWRADVLNRRVRLPPETEMVLVAYADWERADSVSPSELCRFARSHRFRAFLVDTWGKDGSTVLDWLPIAAMSDLTKSLQEDGVSVALAGSIRFEQLELLVPVSPDWFAVRGAVCSGGRGGTVQRELVAQWAERMRAGGRSTGQTIIPVHAG